MGRKFAAAMLKLMGKETKSEGKKGPPKKCDKDAPKKCDKKD